jgi:ankyrin repeat protein
MLGLGADPNERVTWGGVDWTPLAIAIHYGDARVVEALLEHRADPNQRSCVSVESDPKHRARATECTTTNGTTPLMWATSLGRTDMVSLLLKHGAGSTLRDWQGRTAADYAAKRPNPER